MEEGDDETNISFCASYNLKSQWDNCCAKAIGLDPNDEVDNLNFAQEPLSTPYDEDPVPVLFLLSDNTKYDDESMSSSFDDDNNPHNDPWLENCIAISKGIDQMSSLIQRKRRAYARVVNLKFQEGAQEENMTNQERSVLESTVLSFAATTGNQIESLRQSIPPNTGSDIDSHRAGIVSCLLLRLRQEVADPMTKLQKERSKRAVTVWNDPLHCELVSYQQNNNLNSQIRADGSAWDAALNEVRREDPRFIPSTPGPMLVDSNGWVTAYNDIVFEGTSAQQQPLKRPPSKWIHPRSKRKEPTPENPPPPPTPVSSRIKTSSISEGNGTSILRYQRQQMANQASAVQMQPTNNTNADSVMESRQDDEYDEALMIERESAMLLQKVQNEDLENIQKVEAGMTQITALLSQFSNLVSEQQQEIHTIHEQTVSSKKNVNKGQDSLVDATERTKQSKHYMATFIAILAVVLMFFNSVSP